MSKQKTRRVLSRRQLLKRTAAIGAALSVPSLAGLDALAQPGSPLLTAGAAPARRGELVAAFAERIGTLDGANTFAIQVTALALHISDALVAVTNDSRFVPALAESWEAPSPTTWRFTLRRGVTFHDGSPFNADSVVYTLNRARGDTKLVRSFVYQDLVSVEKDGDYAVRITTRRPFGSLPSQLTVLPMLPASASGREEAFFQKPIGTGPFRFVSWTAGERVDLVANPNYWKPGVPRVERLVLRSVPELSTRAAGVRSGEFHVIDRLSPEMVETLKTASGVKALSVLGLEVQQYLFNMAKDPVRNPAFRKAISLGIDRNALVRGLMQGYARAAVCPLPPGLPGYLDLGVKLQDHDRARSLLREANYNGEPIDIVMARGALPKQEEIAQGLQAMLGAIGVRINIKSLEGAAARELRSAGNYDMYYSGWAHITHDPDDYLSQWFTRAGAARLTRYNNPTVEQLVVEGRSPDPNVRRQKYQDVSKILWEEEPMIWPYYTTASYGVRANVTNFQPRKDYYLFLSEVGLG
jgi:peptide/nickel transport system substrate-binding protein